MLHNTGPYGPNETPVNMGASNIPELASQMNIAPNFNNFMKLSQQTGHPSSGHFNLQNFMCYESTSVSSNSQMSIFPNHSYTDYQSKSSSENTNHNSIQHNGGNPEKSEHNKAADSSNSKEVPPETPYNSILEISSLLAKNSKSIHFGLNNKYKDKSEDIENNTQSLINKHEEISSDSESVNSSNNSMESEDQNGRNMQSNYLNNTAIKQDIYEENDSNDSTNSNDSDNEDTHKEVNNTTNDSKDKESDSNDAKPSIFVHFIKQEPIDQEMVDTSIEVRVEQVSSWADTEYKQPFLKDSNGVSREDSSLSNIVDCENSVAQATEIIQNGMNTDLCFECPHCSLLFTHPKRFLIHTKWHSFGLTNEKRREEANEKLAVRKQKKEMQHMIKKEAAAAAKKTKPKPDSFDCKNCDMKFDSKGKLRNHRHKFHPSRERECKVCQVKVLGWFALKKHMATHNTDEFECDVCNKRFKHQHSLQKHKDTHLDGQCSGLVANDSDEYDYECEVCNKTFKHQQSLHKHRQTHLEPTHACAECPKKFGSQTLLKIHMRSHQRAQRGRTFRCSYCGKGFYETYTLQYHERTHRNERPFKCEICDTSYGTNSTLKRHMKVSHVTSQVKPYECSTCKRCFTTELIRDQHAAREHGTPGQLQYACPHCTSRYLRRKDLKRHMYRIHPKGKNRRKEQDSE